MTIAPLKGPGMVRASQLAGAPVVPRGFAKEARKAVAKKKQTTRLLKCQCPSCGYTARITATWLALAIPECPNPDCADDDGECLTRPELEVEAPTAETSKARGARWRAEGVKAPKAGPDRPKRT